MYAGAGVEAENIRIAARFNGAAGGHVRSGEGCRSGDAVAVIVAREWHVPARQFRATVIVPVLTASKDVTRSLYIPAVGATHENPAM